MTVSTDRQRLLGRLSEAAKVCCRPHDGLSMVSYDALRQAHLVATYQWVYRNPVSSLCWGTWNGLRVFKDTAPMSTYLEALDTAGDLLRATKTEDLAPHEDKVSRLVAEFAVLEQGIVRG